MSFGALGENAISAMSLGLVRATGSWVHTSEGGLAKYHTLGGGDLINIARGMMISVGCIGAQKCHTNK